MIQTAVRQPRVRRSAIRCQTQLRSSSPQNLSLPRLVLGLVAGMMPFLPTAGLASSTSESPCQARSRSDFYSGPRFESSQHLAQSNSLSQSVDSDRATDFLVMGGGGAPSYNEIALEKNVLYFQRTLQALGFNPAAAAVYFANGGDGQATVRYRNGTRDLFKPPEIPYLLGSSTRSNFQNWMRRTIQGNGQRPIFFYFTGHGYRNRANTDNNAMILWGEELLSVQEFTSSLDQLPASTPVVTMMAQCYSGSFANLIYQGGSPNHPVALHSRCGFFATVKTRPSVGCTPEVNEADYRDYSSSFFAGLSGRDRTGKPVASADYNRNGVVSYAEAHAFAKVDEQSTDLPVSTLEVWLQQQAGAAQQQILNQPISSLLAAARPEQTYVVESLARQFGFDLQQSYLTRTKTLGQLDPNQDAYIKRLGMELINISMEQRLRQSQDSAKLAVLERLIRCEAGTWTH